MEYSTVNDRPNSHNTRRSNHLYQERCRSKFSQNLPLYIYNFQNILNKWTAVLLIENTSRSNLKRNMMAHSFRNIYRWWIVQNNDHCRECRYNHLFTSGYAVKLFPCSFFLFQCSLLMPVFPVLI